MTPRTPLTIKLGIANGRLLRTYAAHGRTWECEPEGLAQIESQDLPGGRMTLPELLGVLDQRDRKTLEEKLSQSQLDKVGDLLFKVLLGSTETAWQRVLNAVYSVAGKTPLYAPLRVRIQIAQNSGEDRRLWGLPWMTTWWGGKLLIRPYGSQERGWSFETCGHTTELDDVVLHVPPKMLVLAPGLSDSSAGVRVQTATHIMALREQLNAGRRGWCGDGSKPGGDPERYVEVSDLQEARRALENPRFRPEILYYYGHGAVIEEQTYLLFGPGSGKRPRKQILDDKTNNIHLRDLLARLGGPRPKPLLVFLNACSLARAGWCSAGNLLGDDVALVLAHMAPVYGSDATEFAHRVLQQILNGRDPVEAAHELLPAARSSGARPVSDFTSVMVHASYRTWTTHRAPGAGGHAGLKEALELDRESQRAIFRQNLEEIQTWRHNPGDQTQTRPARISVAIAYGSADDALSAAATQLCDHVLKTLAGIAINKVDLWPRPSDPLSPLTRLGLEGALTGLREAVDASIKEPGHVLPALAPRPFPNGDLRVVWLNAGVLPVDVYKRPEPAKQALGQLRAFLRDVILPQMPDLSDVHVVCTLALEMSANATPQKPSELEDLLDPALETTSWGGTLRLMVLSPFGQASRNELSRYLMERGCPMNLVKDLTSTLLALSGGSYQKLVEWLDEKPNLGSYEALLDIAQAELAKAKTTRT
jgi:hypothetical protein